MNRLSNCSVSESSPIPSNISDSMTLNRLYSLMHPTKPCSTYPNSIENSLLNYTGEVTSDTVAVYPR